MDPKETPVPFTESNPPSQVLHPWQAVLRTALALLTMLAVMVKPVLDAVAGGDAETLGPWAGVAVAAGATVTRVLALPVVNAFLERFLPWLAAAGGNGRHEA